jgi:hypothetical protein
MNAVKVAQWIVFVISCLCFLWCAWNLHFAFAMAHPWGLVYGVVCGAGMGWCSRICWRERPWQKVKSNDAT